MSDSALRKFAKENGINVYSLSKTTGRPKLVSRTTLLKRLREAGLGMRKKKFINPNRPLSSQFEQESEQESETDSEPDLIQF